jgi:hypothetical protein
MRAFSRGTSLMESIQPRPFGTSGVPNESAGCDFAAHGWSGSLAAFAATDPSQILAALRSFIPNAGQPQINAWRECIQLLRKLVSTVVRTAPEAAEWGLILEYQMPLEARRADVVVLLNGAVAVLEFKGKAEATDADIDQTHAYARDLQSYHDACHDLSVHPILVPTRSELLSEERRTVFVRGLAPLSQLLSSLNNPKERLLPLDGFLANEAYRPLPSLVAAARELMRSGTLRRVHRAAAATEQAVSAITEIAREAAKTRTRHMVLLTGVPGAGKTLVGLQVVHAHLLDELATERTDRKPGAPAVFLSGNAPLVEVLQNELKGAGGGGKAFVRGVKDYVAYYEARPKSSPPEHVLVFDEAQRAYDAAMMAEKHRVPALHPLAQSEPSHLIEFARRVPDWCVIVGLVGSGQEINRGEEAGMGQWAEAIRASGNAADWKVHGPPSTKGLFEGLRFEENPALTLDRSLRSHLASELHRFVGDLLSPNPTAAGHLRELATKLGLEGHDLWVTRNLERGKSYLRDRYMNDQDARFGILASSRDKALFHFGVDNTAQKLPGFHKLWYAEPQATSPGRSCRELETCETEFGAQGLELEGVLLGWGTDFMISEDGFWSNASAKRHVKKVPIRDPWQLRANAYRVLLTRARDVTIVFVPQMTELNATYDRLLAVGFREFGALTRPASLTRNVGVLPLP